MKNSTESTLSLSIKTDVLNMTTIGSLIEANLTTILNIISEKFNTTDKYGAEVHSFDSNYYYLLFIAILAIISLLVMIFIIIKKKRYNKLRNHLMPIYKFDPSEESGEDWETELLDGMTCSLTKGSQVSSHCRQLYTNEKHGRPQLSFARV